MRHLRGPPHGRAVTLPKLTVTVRPIQVSVHLYHAQVAEAVQRTEDGDGRGVVAADNHRHRSEVKDFSHRRLQIAESLVASAGTHVHIAAVDDDLPLVEEHLVEHRT